MSNDYTFPPVPDHPFANSLSERWSEMEEVAIGRYGHACAEAARAPLLARIAELEGGIEKFKLALKDPIQVFNLMQRGVVTWIGWSMAMDFTGEYFPDEGDMRAAEIVRLRAEVEALRAGIEKAMSEIDDAGPKALKYARQELEAAIAARKGEGSEGVAQAQAKAE